jgi:5-methylcytosine-specific restriction protein A
MPQRVTTHRPLGPLSEALARREYDRSRRNPVSRAFYNSVAWRKLRLVKLCQDPLCEECRRQNRFTTATTVHHRKPVDDYPELRLDMVNLESSCASCHSRHHASERTEA